jgi:hypothetical protein
VIVNENEWLKCANPHEMLGFLRGKVSDRKLRLFAVACCCRAWHLLTSDRSRGKVWSAEQYADEPRSKRKIRKLYCMAQFDNALHESADHAAIAALNPDALGAAFQAASDTSIHLAGGIKYSIMGGKFPKTAGFPSILVTAPTVLASEETAQSDLLRCIIGPLLIRPITLDPSWLTPTVKALAHANYTDRNFEAMPILGDALEEAGCNNEDIMNHCRRQREHTRGCWVLDLLLGNS